jgi:hypothetical protein
VCKTVLYVAVYCGIGVIVYSSIEKKECDDDPDKECAWSALDALYFSVVVMSTVGYGDFSPSTPFTQAFTILYIILGIVVVFSSITECMGIILDPFITWMQSLLDRLFPDALIDVGNGEADCQVPRAWYIHYPKNLLPSISLTLVAQHLSAVVFHLIEGWDYGTALYHCYVTATTVGFGDVSIETDAGRTFAIFHVLLSVCLLGAFISNMATMNERATFQIRRATLLSKRLDGDLLKSLDKDGGGVDQVEFVIGMLTNLEVLDWKDVEPFLSQFAALDKNKDGRLKRSDLQVVANGYWDRITPKGGDMRLRGKIALMASTSSVSSAGSSPKSVTRDRSQDAKSRTISGDSFGTDEKAPGKEADEVIVTAPGLTTTF